MSFKRLLLLCPIALMLSCTSGNDKKPLTLREMLGNKLKREFNAQSYSYGEENHNIFAALLDYNFKFILNDAKSESDDVSLEDQPSGLAVTLFHYLPDSIRESRSEFEVHLKSGGNDFTQTYSSYDLQSASDVFEAVPSFIRWATDTAGSDVLDHRYLNDSARQMVKQQFLDALPGTGKVQFTVMKFESRENDYSDYDAASGIFFSVHCKRGSSETDLYLQASTTNHLVNYVHTGPLDEEK